jgi:plastocyanin
MAQVRASGGCAALLIAVTVAVVSTGSAHAEDPMVRIDNFTFEPQTVTVKAGTTVRWRNDDDIPHTVTASTRAFKSKPLDTGDGFAFTFTTPGTYEYFCSLHPHMKATIVVEADTGRN